MQHGVDQLVAAAVLFVPRFAISVTVLVAFWFGAALVSAAIGRVGGRGHLSPDVLNLGQRLAKASLLVFGAVTALGTAGINVTALVAGLGLTGFALGFAFKDILSNALAGVLILTYRPFRRLDRVSVAGFEGWVAEIDLRYTALEAEGKRILIPNSTLLTNAISVMRAPKPSAAGEQPAVPAQNTPVESRPDDVPEPE